MKSQRAFKLIELNTAGIVYRSLGKLPEAFHVLSQAAELAPDNGGMLSNLGAIRMSQGMDEEAISYFDRAAQLLKEDVAPILNKARIRIRQKEYADAERLLTEARDRHPGHPEIGLLTAQLALTEADHVAAFNGLAKTLEQQPANLPAWRDLNRIEPGAVDLAKLEAAAAAFASVKSTSAALIATVVGVLRKNWAWGSLAKIEGLLNEALLRGRDIHIESSAAFQLLATNVSQEAHKNASHASWSAAASRLVHLKRPTPEPLVGRKLRVGILSSDLRNHAIGYLVVSTIEAHDKSRIEWIAYSNSPDDGGSIRERLRSAFDRFVNVASLSHEEIAAKIRGDKIDVLVDLNGMTAETMVQVFLYKPAPVTVTWLGMPGSLGAGRDVDYVIVDPVVYDAENRAGFDEKAVLLPHSYQPNDAILPRKDPAITRDRYGLPEEAFVFCSFNQHYKYSPDTVALWAQILNANERSVLWILAPEPGSKQRVLEVFGRFNIPAERVIFAEKVPHGEHVQRIGLADLMLDNWPYNAHTTCSDALRAGTPIVTLPGNTFASRVAASILTFSNLRSWIAKSAQDYARIAIDFSKGSRAKINESKQAAFANYAKSAMVDSRTFARNLEEFYLAAFDRALRGENPVHLRVMAEGSVVELDESELVQNRVPSHDALSEGISPTPVHEDSPAQRDLAPAEDPDVAEARQLLALTGLLSPLVVDIGAADLDGQIG
jgi:predicted O-linked N-acetylglucosamine transferase (SPINDLY family)